MAAWNALFVVSGLLLIALAGEMYFRLTKPFIVDSFPSRFVDGVGLIRQPNSEMRYANWRADDFVVSHTNSLGFLDREPISPERAAAGCHIAFIGDSFVEAMHVPIADKFHARLEEIAARELPHLGITAQAYGIANTGQINQLSFYDEYARHLSPKVVVLAFYLNDFYNNSTALYAITNGLDPDRMPFMSAHRDESGALKLAPPDPEFERFTLPGRIDSPYRRAWNRLIQVSYFAKWLDTKNLIRTERHPIPIDEYADMIAERPCCGWVLDVVWRRGLVNLDNFRDIGRPFREERMPPAYEEALAYTAFGVEQFKRRSDRDGARLIILAATDDMGMRGDPQFDRIIDIAEALDIPVISQYAYVVSQGYDYDDGQLRGDLHWNATGHQWAAEAVLEWLKANQGVCD